MSVLKLPSYDYCFIDISQERKEALKKKEDEWKKLVKKYHIRVGGHNGD